MTKTSSGPFFALLMNAESRLDLKWVIFPVFVARQKTTEKRKMYPKLYMKKRWQQEGSRWW